MSTEKLNRRTFAGMLAAGTAAPLAALAAEPQAKPAAQKPADAAEKQDQSEGPAREDLILEMVKATYPDRLQPEHLEAIKQEIVGNLARSHVLSLYPLTNGDAPTSVFRAYRGPSAPRKV